MIWSLKDLMALDRALNGTAKKRLQGGWSVSVLSIGGFDIEYQSPENLRAHIRIVRSDLLLRLHRCVRVIGFQFPQVPEGKLMLAVIGQAIVDLADSSTLVRESAMSYLSSEMPHAELCGVSSEWIRKILAAARCDPGWDRPDDGWR